MLGVSEAATVGLKFTVNYCSFGNYVNYVNAPAFGMATNLWQNLTAMGTGYNSCSGDTSYSLSDVISKDTVNTPPGGLYPLPNGSITVNWFGFAANWSGLLAMIRAVQIKPNPSSGPPGEKRKFMRVLFATELILDQVPAGAIITNPVTTLILLG